jgi:hypothetical protein
LANETPGKVVDADCQAFGVADCYFALATGNFQGCGIVGSESAYAAPFN